MFGANDTDDEKMYAFDSTLILSATNPEVDDDNPFGEPLYCWLKINKLPEAISAPLVESQLNLMSVQESVPVGVRNDCPTYALAAKLYEPVVCSSMMPALAGVGNTITKRQVISFILLTTSDLQFKVGMQLFSRVDRYK